MTISVQPKVFILKDWWEVGVTTKFFYPKWAKIDPFWAEWTIQNLIINRWVKIRVSPKNLISNQIQSIFAHFWFFFGTVTLTSHQSIRINTLVEHILTPSHDKFHPFCQQQKIGNKFFLLYTILQHNILRFETFNARVKWDFCWKFA